jgi:poly-gamma-glutamate capsule biosynthesis protein CapA/YwtB (metallophosphatase superfamily)
VRLALAGDTMLGRGVAEQLGRRPPDSLVDGAIVEITRAADLFVLNLECCISDRGEPVHGKVFTFRAQAAAVETLRHLGVNCVTLENNHALDYGPDALQDTLAYLREAGIAYAGAGEDVEEARAPAVVRGLPIVGRRWSTVWRGSRMAKKGSVAALPASVCRLDKYCRNGGHGLRPPPRRRLAWGP